MFELPISADSIDALFSATFNGQAQMSALAQSAISQGADLYSKGKYDAAVSSFKRAIALDPSAENAPQAFNLLATTYIKQNKISDAVNTYKASLSISPSDDNAHIKLGNIYYNQKNYRDAEKEYKAAVQLSPTSSTNLFSLGQVYLATGRTLEAENTFKRVISMDPTQYGGYYSLGQTFSKEGRQQDAIQAFEKVISLKNSFNDVRVDLGSAYADLGQMDKAQEQLDYLNSKSQNLATLLAAYMAKVAKPKIVSADTTTGFSSSLWPGTPVVALDPTLVSPNASAVLNMVFVFDKTMDANSVQNPTNWTISKSTTSTPGGAYNWGLPSPETDVPISSIPLSIVYLPETKSAIVSFVVEQNASANGTIDPSHIDFKFRGKDSYGNAMDPKADEYNGISLIA